MNTLIHPWPLNDAIPNRDFASRQALKLVINDKDTLAIRYDSIPRSSHPLVVNPVKLLPITSVTWAVYFSHSP